MFWKKGLAEHVDWIVAIGIFIIYFIMVIVFFRPGITNVYSGEEMLNVLQGNFMDEAYWDITKVPVFVEPIPYVEETTDASGKVTRSVEYPNLIDEPLVFTGDKVTIINKNAEGEDVKIESGSSFPLNDKIELKKSKIFYVKSSDTDSFADSHGNDRPNTARGFECGAIDNSINSDKCLPNSYKDTDDERAKKMKDGRATIIKITEKASSNSVVSDTGTAEYKKRDGYLKFRVFSNKMIVPGKLKYNDINKKTTYTLIYNNERENIDPQAQEYSTSNLDIPLLDPDDVSLNYICDVSRDYVTNENKLINYNTLQKKCKGRYVIGVPETTKGLDVVQVFNYLNYNKNKGGTTVLCSDNPTPTHPSCSKCGASDSDYDCIKKVWAFPMEKDFRVTVYNEDMSKIYASFPEGAVIPKNVNVYSRQFESYILDDDGLLTPVVVQLQAF